MRLTQLTGGALFGKSLRIAKLVVVVQRSSRVRLWAVVAPPLGGTMRHGECHYLVGLGRTLLYSHTVYSSLASSLERGSSHRRYHGPQRLGRPLLPGSCRAWVFPWAHSHGGRGEVEYRVPTCMAIRLRSGRHKQPYGLWGPA